jgi:hypothetical protein
MIRTRVEVEVRRRVDIALWAYAYEICADPIVDDGTFDEEAAKIDLTIDTPRPELDEWFRKEFSPHTGSWIHTHPDLKGLERLYQRHLENRLKPIILTDDGNLTIDIA